MIAGMVLSNLLYVVGAIVAATVVSGIVLLRHRRPRSLESSIEMFSRELRALRPEHPGARTFDGEGAGGPEGGGRGLGNPRPGPPGGLRAGRPAGYGTGRPAGPRPRAGTGRSGGMGGVGGAGGAGTRSGGPRSVSRLTATQASEDGRAGPTAPGHDEARAPSPDQEAEPG